VVYRHSTDLPCYTSIALCDECRQKSCLLIASSVVYRLSSLVRESVSRSLLVSAIESCVLPMNHYALRLVCLRLSIHCNAYWKGSRIRIAVVICRVLFDLTGCCVIRINMLSVNAGIPENCVSMACLRICTSHATVDGWTRV
jgi:hypothetical protein